MHIVVVTGMSGAGRSTALHVLEDLGHYCVDNLPPALAPNLVELTSRGTDIKRIGLGIDVRNGAFLESSDEALTVLREAGHDVEVIFLDAADEVLVRRYSETRRPHPLAPKGDVQSAIAEERDRLATIRAEATRVVDTSELSVHDLKRVLVAHLLKDGARREMIVRIVSFGFKYGLPKDADLVFDLRYLPNPYFVPDLRPKTGLDIEVSSYVLEREASQELLVDLTRFFGHTLPRYASEGKAYLTIAIGCTGGRHRSVAMSEELGIRLAALHPVHVSHRDVRRKSRQRTPAGDQQ